MVQQNLQAKKTDSKIHKYQNKWTQHTMPTYQEGCHNLQTQSRNKIPTPQKTTDQRSTISSAPQLCQHLEQPMEYNGKHHRR